MSFRNRKLNKIMPALRLEKGESPQEAYSRFQLEGWEIPEQGVKLKEDTQGRFLIHESLSKAEGNTDADSGFKEVIGVRHEDRNYHAIADAEIHKISTDRRKAYDDRTKRYDDEKRKRSYEHDDNDDSERFGRPQRHYDNRRDDRQDRGFRAPRMPDFLTKLSEGDEQEAK